MMFPTLIQENLEFLSGITEGQTVYYEYYLPNTAETQEH